MTEMIVSARLSEREDCLSDQWHSWKELRIALTRNIYLISDDYFCCFDCIL
jgi:enolase